MKKENFFYDFFKLESSAGILLMISALLAIIVANSPLNIYYQDILATKFAIAIGSGEINKAIILWINDGLMAVFFFVIGLELKREFIEGELSSLKDVVLPGIAAVGGMLVPALIYAVLNSNDSVAMRGWAIPSATDIAFALGVLTLIGNKVPLAIKVFLTTVAIFDDIGAIAIIAVFYTESLGFQALGFASLGIVILGTLNYLKVTNKKVYILLFAIIWVALLKSGLHATLTGIIVALFIPMYNKNKSSSPVKELEHDCHSLVSFLILPVFAFANSGISLTDIALDDLFHPATLGIILGLFVGKQIGIFGICYILVKTKLIRLPKNITLLSLYGVSLLCGIGFTMSLFIESLAFNNDAFLSVDTRLGIIIGSLLSGVTGYIFLKKIYS